MSAGRMKAAIFVEPGRIVLDQKPTPDVGDGEHANRCAVRSRPEAAPCLALLQRAHQLLRGIPIDKRHDVIRRFWLLQVPLSLPPAAHVFVSGWFRCDRRSTALAKNASGTSGGTCRGPLPRPALLCS